MGKNVVPVRVARVVEGIEVVTDAGSAARMDVTGLNPRKAAKTALVAGIWLKNWESCGTPAAPIAEVNAPGRLPVREEMIMVKKTARLTV